MRHMKTPAWLQTAASPVSVSQVLGFPGSSLPWSAQHCNIELLRCILKSEANVTLEPLILKFFNKICQSYGSLVPPTCPPSVLGYFRLLQSSTKELLDGRIVCGLSPSGPDAGRRGQHSFSLSCVLSPRTQPCLHLCQLSSLF